MGIYYVPGEALNTENTRKKLRFIFWPEAVMETSCLTWAPTRWVGLPRGSLDSGLANPATTIFVNNMFLKHNRIHLFVYCLKLLSHWNDLQKPKIFTV